MIMPIIATGMRLSNAAVLVSFSLSLLLSLSSDVSDVSLGLVTVRYNS